MKHFEKLKILVPPGPFVWTAIGASVLTMAVGFTLVGWTTAGAAERLAREAAAAARLDLATQVCAANFAMTPAAFEQREEMLVLPSFRQASFVREQPWALMPGDTEVQRAVAERCA